jgi:cytochrome oxidase Cu insertion factor (SCO1/SenC/PrrC family)
MNISTIRTRYILSFLFLAWFIAIPDLAVSGSKEPLPLKGSFSLVDETGKKVSLESYRGRYLLIYFGYTYCPDVCPTSLGIIAEILEGLPKKSLDKIIPLFITVDPERDTVEHMREYTEAFHPSLVGLTGSVTETSRAARTFGVYFAKAEIDPDDSTAYLVDHSSNTFFIDPQGRIVEIYGHAPLAQKVINDLKQHLEP